MNQDDHSELDAADRFRTTRWSVVLLSAQSQMPGSKFALAELCGLYWYPVYGFVRYRGHAPHDAQDLTQSFFLYLLEHKALSRVDPLKGKFPGEVDDEIHALCEAIIASEGRLDP